MKRSTIEALNRINQRFYSRQAGDFSATRNSPWKGWERAVSGFVQRYGRRPPAAAVAARILDAGCGNGRFAEYLDESLATPCRYLGLDSSPEMLAVARRRLRDLRWIEGELSCCDLTSRELGRVMGRRRFDLIAAFGVLHHIPAFDGRLRLLQRLRLGLAAEGLLLLSFWQFAEQPRFQRRFLDWSDHNRIADQPIPVGDLEAGDHLLRWRDDGYRYCHHATDDEALALVDSVGLTVVDRFRADGRNGELNLYIVAEGVEN